MICPLGVGDGAHDGATARVPRLHRQVTLGYRYTCIRIYVYMYRSPPLLFHSLSPPPPVFRALSFSLYMCVWVYISPLPLQIIDHPSFLLLSFSEGVGDGIDDGATARVPRLHRKAALGYRYTYIRIYRYKHVSPFLPFIYRVRIDPGLRVNPSPSLHIRGQG